MRHANILFSGADGWATGMRPLGLTDTVGFEFNHAAVTTARANNHYVIEGDLSKVDPADHPALGLIGSPPCQGLSPAGKKEGQSDFNLLRFAITQIRVWLRWVAKSGGHGPLAGFSPEQAIAWLAARIRDPKSALILEPVRWAVRMPQAPHWIALEQVKTALPIWEAMADLYRDMGYSVWTGVVHMEEFGLGTTRERAILLASLDHDLSAGPTKTHTRYHHSRKDRRFGYANEKGLQPYVTAADLLGFREAIVDPVMAWPERDSVADAAWVYTRPMVAMVGSFRPDIAAGPGYRKPGDGPRQNAKGSIILTVEQAAKVQGFPDDYVWDAVSEADARLQIGNAVPPTLATVLIRFVTQGV